MESTDPLKLLLFLSSAIGGSCLGGGLCDLSRVNNASKISLHLQDSLRKLTLTACMLC